MKIRQKFNNHAVRYDSSRQQLIPCYTDFYGSVLKVIPFPKNAPIRALDLGAGTGLLSQMIVQQFPNVQMHLIDVSEKMLTIAKKHLKKHHNVSYEVLDYAQNFPEQTYDLIVSALSIHHLSNTDKQNLFKRIKGSLNSNGIFINADQVLGESDDIETIHQARWLQEVKNNGVSKITLSEALDRMKEDKMTPLSTQLNWLKTFGFTEVNCWYKNYRFAVYSGTKNS